MFNLNVSLDRSANNGSSRVEQVLVVPSWGGDGLTICL